MNLKGVLKLIGAGTKKARNPDRANKANLKARLEKELLTYERMQVKGTKGLDDKIMKLKHELRKDKKAPKAKESMTMPKIRKGDLHKEAAKDMETKRERINGKPVPNFLAKQAGPKVKTKGSSHTPAMLKKQAY